MSKVHLVSRERRTEYFTCSWLCLSLPQIIHALMSLRRCGSVGRLCDDGFIFLSLIQIVADALQNPSSSAQAE